jgi:hypothetical protein
MEDWCPECVSGGYGHPVYFDVAGREIDESDAADNEKLTHSVPIGRRQRTLRRCIGR